jgi:hypothetical protein
LGCLNGLLVGTGWVMSRSLWMALSGHDNDDGCVVTASESVAE